MANLLAAIDRSRAATLARFLFGLGIRHVGEQVARLLAAHAGSLERLAAAPAEELTAVRGVGPEIAASVAAFFSQEENRRTIRELLSRGVAPAAGPGSPPPGTGPLAGLSFVFTGALAGLPREEAQALVARGGGRSVASVSRATSYVVVGADPGSKAAQAGRLGVPRLTEQEFRRLLRERGVQ